MSMKEGEWVSPNYWNGMRDAYASKTSESLQEFAISASRTQGSWPSTSPCTCHRTEQHFESREETNISSVCTCEPPLLH